MYSITVEPRKSAMISAFLVLLHLLAIIAIYYTDLLIIIQLFFGGIIILSISYQLFYRSRNKIVRIIYQSNQWLLEDESGNFYMSELLSDSFVSIPMIILRFKFFKHQKKMVRSIILTADVIDRDLLRQIRVVLYCQ